MYQFLGQNFATLPFKEGCELFKEGTWQGILADFAMPFFKLFGPGVDFLDIFCAQNDCPVIGYLMGTEIF